jgi:hypothetical protein
MDNRLEVGANESLGHKGSVLLNGLMSSRGGKLAQEQVVVKLSLAFSCLFSLSFVFQPLALG